MFTLVTGRIVPTDHLKMSEKNSEYEIPNLDAKLFFGLSTNIYGNVHFLSDHELMHPAGKVLVIDDFTNDKQKFIKVPSSSKEISIISISPDRKYVVVAEKGNRPTLSVYDVANLGRLKLLGVPQKGNSSKDWASVAFLQDHNQLVAVTKDPDWSLLVYDWQRGKVLYTGVASQRGLSVSQVVPNPEDGTVMAVVGAGLFRLLSQSDSSWRQYGFSRAERVPLQTATWIGSQQLLAGSWDGRLLLIHYGELRAVYQADSLSQIHLTESALKTSETVTLASQVVPEENMNGLHEVRALISFKKGFLYSCNVGEVIVFEKIDPLRWVKSNVIKIPSSSPEAEYRKIFKISYASVNPSNDRIVVTIKKTVLYSSNLFKKTKHEMEKKYMEFALEGSGYHDGPIVALSTCLWKPIFLTAGAHDKTIRIWNYETLKVIIIKRFSDEIYSAALHPSGFFCLLGFTDKLRFMLILVNNLKTIRHADIRGCRNVAFAGGGHIFAATREQVIEVYSAIHFTRLHILHGHLGPVMKQLFQFSYLQYPWRKVTRLVFGLRDKCLWSCGAEGSLYEWDMESGKRLGDIFTNKNGQLGLAVSEAAYTVGTDGNLKEIINGEISREIDMQQSSLTAVTLGNSGQMLFLGGEKSSVVSVVYPLVHPQKWTEFVMHCQPIADIVISANDRSLITTSEDGFLCIWRISGGERIGPGDGHVSEILLSLSELEAMSAGIRELRDRLIETEGEHEYSIRQITASNHAALRETNNNYTSIIEDLKFKIKQMEREHLVEMNKFQNKLKDEKTSHGDGLDQLEKRYSHKLLAELRRIEELEKLVEKLKDDNERLKVEMNEKLITALDQIESEKNAIVEEKDLRIFELESISIKMEEEKERTKLILQEEFNKRKEDVGKSFITKILEKEMLIGKLKCDNGILVKTHILIRKENDELKKKVKQQEKDLLSKEEKLKFSTQDAEIVKTQLFERESVIAKKDRAIVKMTKQNDVYKRELLFRDTTAEALLGKIAPKDSELKLKDRIIEEKNKEMDELSKFKTKCSNEIEQLKKKSSLSEKEIKKQKLQYGNLKALLRKINLEIYIAASFAYQPQQLKEQVIKMSEKLDTANKFEIEEDKLSYQEIIDKQSRMDKVIRDLQTKLELSRKRVKVVRYPHKIAYELLTQFNHMALELNDNRNKARYLKKLLSLSLRKK